MHAEEFPDDRDIEQSRSTFTAPSPRFWSAAFFISAPCSANHKDHLMNRIAIFLAATTFLAGPIFLANSAFADMLDVEKDELTLGSIKLTDMAPVAIATEKGFFEDEGLYVMLEPQANWKVLLDGVISGQLDGAQMLAGQPIAASIGYGTSAKLVTPFSMDLNGNAITVSNAVWDLMKPAVPVRADGKPQHPISAAALKPVLESYAADGKPFNLGMVFPVSTHN